MVFSSMPSYLDSSNWHHQQQQQQQQQQQLLQLQHQQNQGGFQHGISLITNPNPLLPPPPLPPPQNPPSQAGPMLVQPGSIRPGSMAERARMANIPMPETALKCPRCESTNTKFCYFNNYSLSQPRHFCKTCRRYWTRGGALRTVPVGGGCRRNKRSSKSSSSSKSAATSSNAATSSATSHASVVEMMGLSPLRFMSPMHHMTSEFGEQLGLSGYGEIPGPFLGSGLFGNPFEAVEFSRLKAEVVKEEGMSLVRRFNNNGNINGGNQGSNVGEENYNWVGGSGNVAWTDHLNSALLNNNNNNNNSSCSNSSAL